MANYYCKNCGKSFTSIKYLTREKCIRNPLGTYKGYHELYEGSEKDQYFCKYCGKSFKSIKAMTVESCIKHPNGNYKGKHSPAL
ncbi:MAG: C2H2-type zinc finger protein [Spirochaetales bacterium]|nr:C2H2-type zinc finger protein [Spirochaetales bacterium]